MHKSRTKNDRGMLTPEGLALKVKTCVRRHFGDERHAVKKLSNRAGCDERTARNWWEGRNAPAGHALINLALQVPELRAELRRLLDLEADLDPEMERATDALVRAWLRRRGET